MNPVKTAGANFVMRGPTIDIGDIWVEVEPGGTTNVDWLPTEAEREAIARGAVVRLSILQFPMPPVSLVVRPDLQVVDTTSPPVPEP